MLEVSAVADWMLGVQMSSFFLSLIGMEFTGELQLADYLIGFPLIRSPFLFI